MKKIQIIKAAPMPGERTVESVEIHISGRLDTRGLSMDEVAQTYEQEAQKLVDALFGSLPGALFDRVAGQMLAKVASRLIVAHEAPKPAKRRGKAKQ